MKEIIDPPRGPRAVGPYSPGVKAAGLVFLSGQIPLDPDTQKMIPGTIEEQTRRVLRNIGILLEAAGSGYEKVLRVGVFLDDLGDFEAMNGVYAEFFSESRPARSTVEVARLPKDVKIEIDVIALA